MNQAWRKSMEALAIQFKAIANSKINSDSDIVPNQAQRNCQDSQTKSSLPQDEDPTFYEAFPDRQSETGPFVQGNRFFEAHRTAPDNNHERCRHSTSLSIRPK